MLTGRVAFAGDTISDTIAAILGREPEWSALKMPASLRRVLQRCLDKDPRRRFDIADVRIEIEDVISGAAGTPADATPSTHGDSRSSAGVACGGRGAGRRRRADVEPSDGSTGTDRTAAHLAHDDGVVGHGGARHRQRRSLAITPDGTRVVYVGSNNQLFVRPLDRLDATAIYTGAAPLNWVFVSPDGQWVGFAEARVLKKVAITGGPAETIAGPILDRGDLGAG